jgi:hypothetical protein
VADARKLEEIDKLMKDPRNDRRRDDSGWRQVPFTVRGAVTNAGTSTRPAHSTARRAETPHRAEPAPARRPGLTRGGKPGHGGTGAPALTAATP